MGIFDRFKKKNEVVERLENAPDMLTAKLLFFERPTLDTSKIQNELEQRFARVEMRTNDDKTLLYFFPDYPLPFEDANICGQCTIFFLDDDNPKAGLPTEAFQQNWHWGEANETAMRCKHELIITDLMTRVLDYKQRVDLFVKFLVAVVKATNPQAVFSGTSQMLIDPRNLVERFEGGAKEILFSLVNVRLFRISNSDEPKILMDTVGLYSLGLPDFQVLLPPSKENRIARLLWDYAYYVFEHGDIVESGNTLAGLDSGSKWRCERAVSSVKPGRVVINVQP